MYVRLTQTAENYLEWIGGAFDPGTDLGEESRALTPRKTEKRLKNLVVASRSALAAFTKQSPRPKR
jgi:hypothetical protein